MAETPHVSGMELLPEKGSRAKRTLGSCSGSTLHHIDAFEWLAKAKRHSIHAVVTDPPYGLIEYSPEQLAKRKNGSGGVWRVDVVSLRKNDWKYEGSKADRSGGGRTHTFGLKKAAATLRGKAVYRRADVVLIGGKAVPKNGD